MSKEDLEKLANEIAEKANECCYRSDGYEEEIRDITLEALEKAASLPLWISIRDQEPPKGTPVLITDGKVIVASFWQIQRVNYRGPFSASPTDLPRSAELMSFVRTVDYIWEGYGFGGPEWEWSFRDWQITHWMLLPALPGKELKHV